MVSLKLNIFVINLLKTSGSLNSLDIWNAYRDNFSTFTRTEGAAGNKAFSKMFCSTVPQRNRAYLLFSPAPGTSQTQQGLFREQHEEPLPSQDSVILHWFMEGVSTAGDKNRHLLLWVQADCSVPKSGTGRNGSCQPWDHSGEALPPKTENCCSRTTMRQICRAEYNILIIHVQDRNKLTMGTKGETSGENRAQPPAGDQTRTCLI